MNNEDLNKFQMLLAGNNLTIAASKGRNILGSLIKISPIYAIDNRKIGNAQSLIPAIYVLRDMRNSFFCLTFCIDFRHNAEESNNACDIVFFKNMFPFSDFLA